MTPAARVQLELPNVLTVTGTGLPTDTVSGIISVFAPNEGPTRPKSITQIPSGSVDDEHATRRAYSAQTAGQSRFLMSRYFIGSVNEI